MINWLPNSMLLILRYQPLVEKFTKTQYNSEKQDIEKKIGKKVPNCSELVRKTD